MSDSAAEMVARLGRTIARQIIVNPDRPMAGIVIQELTCVVGLIEAARDYLEECDSAVPDPIFRRGRREAMRAALRAIEQAAGGFPK